jgi:hypothetical protein
MSGGELLFPWFGAQKTERVVSPVSLEFLLVHGRINRFDADKKGQGICDHPVGG